MSRPAHRISSSNAEHTHKESELRAYATQVDDLTAVRSAYGSNDQFRPADVIILVIAIAGAWVNAPDGLRPHATNDRLLQRDLVAGAVSVLTKSQRRRPRGG